MRHLSGLAAVNVIMAGFFARRGSTGRSPRVVLALLCGAAGGGLLVLGRRRQAYRAIVRL
jgi:hypothetical protein